MPIACRADLCNCDVVEKFDDEPIMNEKLKKDEAVAQMDQDVSSKLAQLSMAS